jgi:enamine deaminase RidA (YjgF/YER057c/UK114 family)
MTRFRLLAALMALAVSAYPFEKKKKEEITQTLELPKEPPASVTAETARLVFHVTPLSAKGLLSQQVRDALKALLKTAGGETVVKLRAFVAGSGDLRRVQAIVSEVFTEKRLPLPALSVVQVGALPLEGAQVVIESVAVAKKELNPLGLVFISGQTSAAHLKMALEAAGSGDALRVTCFSSAFEDQATLRAALEVDYRHAALDFVQLRRGGGRSVVECEAVARLARKITAPAQFENPASLAQDPNYSQLALVSAPRLALTGAQIAYGFEDSDARLAFQRLAKVLEQAGSSMRDVVMASFYPLSTSIAGQVRKIRLEFFDPSRAPASTLLPFEGLPAMDAGFAVEVAATAR